MLALELEVQQTRLYRLELFDTPFPPFAQLSSESEYTTVEARCSVPDVGLINFEIQFGPQRC